MRKKIYVRNACLKALRTYIFVLSGILFAAWAEEAEQVEEQVDEIKIEAQSADCGDFACVGTAVVGKHCLDFLGVPCCQPDENGYAGKADYPVHRAACNEDVDNCADDKSEQSHHHQRAEARKVVFSKVSSSTMMLQKYSIKPTTPTPALPKGGSLNTFMFV